ncbi:HlyD family secretion protein [Oryzifoliimicrobium ureilyticus]|uniref:HlyD family secretion protein n=1 Tax=Oryzifoliimicrobium ureilyticus TaxID=3113724 RepID=UPI0030768067
MSSNSKSKIARIVPEDAQPVTDTGAPAADPTAEARNAPQAPNPPAPAVAPPQAEKKKRRSLVLPIIGLAVLAGAAWYGYDWWTVGRFMVSTDDAYVEGDIATISPKVTGYVASVAVDANKRVKAGDVLLTLDDGDYKNALDQAEAQVATQRLALSRIDAQIDGAKASLTQAEAQKTALDATVRGAEITFKRQTDLNQRNVGTAAELDNSRIALDQARANLAAGDANIIAARANIEILQAQRQEAEGAVRSAEISRDKAARDLSFTIVKAPYDGVIGNRSVQVGDLVSPGQRLMAVVPEKQLYIDANFKETQIQHLVPGSKVNVHVDAYSDHSVVGTVESIAPASGAVFSLLPPENATGNFTKIIQRVPVRISLPQDALATGRLRAGLSVVVDVDTRTAPDAGQAN